MAHIPNLQCSNPNRKLDLLGTICFLTMPFLRTASNSMKGSSKCVRCLGSVRGDINVLRLRNPGSRSRFHFDMSVQRGYNNTQDLFPG